MTAYELTETEETVKRLVLKGTPRKEIARQTNKGDRTVYNIIEKLERIGHLIHIPGTRSPKAYEDGIATLSLSVCNSSGSSKSCKPNSPPIEEGIAPLPFVMPTKTVRVHFSGAFTVSINVEGKFGRISDDRGFTIGGWTDSHKLKGDTEVYQGYIRIDGGQISLQYFKSKSGKRTMNIAPAERNIYYRHAVKDGEQAIVEQVSKAVIILRKHGWGFIGNPSPNGDLHYGTINEDLLPYVDWKEPKSDDGVFADKSNGHPEIETTARNPNAQSDIIALAELPLRLQMMEQFCLSATSMLEQLQSNQDSTTRILASIQQSQTTILELMTGIGTNFTKEGYA